MEGDIRGDALSTLIAEIEQECDSLCDDLYSVGLRVDAMFCDGTVTSMVRTFRENGVATQEQLDRLAEIFESYELAYKFGRLL